uniref:Uncharacterized protein n=1 Tax=Anguilla anguilla TaxID=7936 RepID=A0A0E9TEH5_ANGAN
MASLSMTSRIVMCWHAYSDYESYEDRIP